MGIQMKRKELIISDEVRKLNFYDDFKLKNTLWYMLVYKKIFQRIKA